MTPRSEDPSRQGWDDLRAAFGNLERTTLQYIQVPVHPDNVNRRPDWNVIDRFFCAIVSGPHLKSFHLLGEVYRDDTMRYPLGPILSSIPFSPDLLHFSASTVVSYRGQLEEFFDRPDFRPMKLVITQANMVFGSWQEALESARERKEREAEKSTMTFHNLTDGRFDYHSFALRIVFRT